MTKLTTERLSKLRDNLLQFQDSYSDPADKENYDIFVDALHMLDEFKAAKEQLLAYEQAAEKPYGYLEPCDFPRTTATVYPEKDKYAFMPLYAAPVLPKQPIVLYMGRELISKEGLELIRDGVSEATKLEGACMASTILGGNHHAQPVSEPYKLPSGYALVPCKLTAENGAKSCMIGEFTEQTEISCPECFGDDECETCDGSGMIEVTVPVSWTTIKDIWAKGIEHFAAAAAQESE
ncbi:hypothetical protein [Hafnia paralvei]|uniref:hypothetical protein n=1 Tax=Hafnia paralvei TaxID=546367 RepID=UPI001D121104|nr:hypothetical protein [Hafnia paralvei]